MLIKEYKNYSRRMYELNHFCMWMAKHSVILFVCELYKLNLLHVKNVLGNFSNEC